MPRTATDLGKVQTDMTEDCPVVLRGVLPNSYCSPCSGGRVYTPGNSEKDGPVLQMQLTAGQTEQLGLHIGVEYEIRLRPIPPREER